MLLMLIIFLSLTHFILIEAQVCEKYDHHVGNVDKKFITDKHNEFRSLVLNGALPGQPKALAMAKIQFDEVLARAAQIIANTCIFKPDKVLDARWNHVGQNMYTCMSQAYDKGANWTEALHSWFDEFMYFDYGPIIEIENTATEHYTQIVWARTEFIGCGYSYFVNEDYWYQKIYVCNYGPGGNVEGALPYRTKGVGRATFRNFRRMNRRIIS